MSWNVKINGIPGLDGEYPLDWDFKNKHWRTIEKMADVGVLELQPALKAGRTSVLVALIAVALDQADKPFVEDALWEAGPGALSIEEVKDPDASPPVKAPPEPSDEKEASGGNGNRTGDDSQATLTPTVTGTPV